MRFLKVFLLLIGISFFIVACGSGGGGGGNGDGGGGNGDGGGGGTFQTSTIDSSADVGVGSSIAIDSNNKAHVSYYDITNKAIKYATNVSGAWVSTTIATNVDGGGSPSQSVIKIDSNYKVHIIYYDYYNGGIKYSTNISGAWTTSTIAAGSNFSMVIDANNKLHVSHSGGVMSATGLYYTTNASGAWVSSAIDNPPQNSVYSTAIAIDKNNKLHILYYLMDWNISGGKASLKYANNSSGSWSLTLVDSVSSSYNGLGIAVDSNVKIHATYGEYPTSWNLKYITNVTGSWVSTTIGSKNDNWSFTSVVVDTNDKIHACAIGGSPRVQYITNSSGIWVTDNIDDAQWSIAMALDSNNKVHIAYYATPMSGPLKYATNSN